MKKIYLLLAILLATGFQALYAQTHLVKGRILDETGQGYPGAGVNVKGTNIGTATDVDGNFQLNVPDDKNVLVVQAIGYNRQEVTVSGGTLTVHMVPNARFLKETVVTALGIRKEKRAIGYAQATVDSEAIYKSGQNNIVEGLAGQTSGVQVTSSSGTPGASSRIAIRGIPNLQGGNSPIFVVDGIVIDNSTSQPVAGDYPYNLNLSGVNESNRGIDIDPDDIASVSVLKGPAAAALYGSSGGNGAIIITTKKGRYRKGMGNALGVTYRSSVEFDQVDKLPSLQNQYLQGTNGVFNTFSPTSAGTPNSWGPNKDTMPGIKTYDKYKDFFNTGVGFTNNIAVDGGNEFNTFRLSYGNYSATGVIPNSSIKRNTITLSGESKQSSWLTVGGSADYSNTNTQMVQNGSTLGGVMLTMLRAPINYNIKNYKDPKTGFETQYYTIYDNPLYSAYENPYTDQTNRVFGNLYANAKISDAWSINWKIGTDMYSTQTKQIYAVSSYADDNNDALGQINLANMFSRMLYSDFIVHYDKALSDKITFNSFIGYNFWYLEGGSTFSRGRQLQIPDFYNLNNASQLYASNTDNYERRQGVYGDAQLSYGSFLYLDVTGRNDWTTAFGPAGRSLFYPKADLSWIFTEHIKQNDILNYGKLRVAYSDAGLGPTPYTYFRTIYYTQPFITDGYTNGNGFPYLGQTGYAPSNIYFPGNLKPADNEGQELGLELRMFKNRVSFDGTIYNQVSHNNLITEPIAPSSGFQYQWANSGDVQNKGIELGLSVDILKSKNFKWTLSGNFTKNVSKVLDLANGVNILNTETGFSEIGSYAIVGQPYDVFYGTAWMRDAKTGKILVDDQGQALVDTVNHVIGNPNPKWLMNISNNFNWKGFNFSFLIDIRHGGDIWDGTYARLNNIGISSESADRNRTFVVDGEYASTGQKNTTPVSAQYYWQTFRGDKGNYAAENAVEDGSWVRLRSVNLSYRFNFRKKHANSTVEYLELGVSGNNLILITKYRGVDPETSLTGAGSNILGYDYFNNPGVRSYAFNLRLGL